MGGNQGDTATKLEVPGVLSAGDLAATAGTILDAQEGTGAIPWFEGGDADPWDHVECAMALSAAGEWAAAERAYAWLTAIQREDGSWPMRIRAACPRGTAIDPAADTNQCAYVAVGVWHHIHVTGDTDFAWRMWPVVRGAVDFVLTLQQPSGEVAWARDATGRAAPGALLAGCSSIHQSLRCAVALARHLGCPSPQWESAARTLAQALAQQPDGFEDRQRYSMDWYYPVLGGAVRGAAGARLVEQRWEEFVLPGLGVRCVSDRPWVTGAETCELALTLDALGEPERAATLVADMQHLRHEDGSYWTGYVFEDGVRWPVERSTWTGASVILAADALAQATSGACLFRSVPRWDAKDVADSDSASADAVADALDHS